MQKNGRENERTMRAIKQSLICPHILLPLMIAALWISLYASESYADRVYLKDGVSFRCNVLDEIRTVNGENFYQIQLDNSFIWLNSNQVQKIEKTDEVIRTDSVTREKIEQLMREGSVVTQIEADQVASSTDGQDSEEVPLKVKEVRGWVYLYENEKAIVERKRSPLHVGESVPLGKILIVSPNSRVTLAIGEIGEIGLTGQTRIRFDQLTVSRTQTFEVGLNLTRGAFWAQVGVQQATWKRVKLTINTSSVILQQGTLYVESAERTGAVYITNLSLNRDLKFYRATEIPSDVRVGERVFVSPASNRLTVDANQNASELQERIANWADWEPAPLVVELEPVIPPLKTYPEYPPVPALHPYRITIDTSMAFSPETRSLGQILKIYDEAVERYKRDTGRYPSPQHGINALVYSYEVSGWRGPYIPQDVPRHDFWGNPFVYDLYKVNGREYADVRSVGPNGQDDRGLGDDIR